MFLNYGTSLVAINSNRQTLSITNFPWSLENYLIQATVSVLLTGAERGKIYIQPVGNDAYHCEYASFGSSFSSGIPVRVFASVNQGNESSQVHDSALAWVEDISIRRFKACVVTGGQGSHGNTTIDWFAFQGSQSGVQHGETRFTLFTTGTKCNQVTFSQVRSCF